MHILSILSTFFLIISYIIIIFISFKRNKIKLTDISVSILKPLKGIDDELEENLNSFYNQTHKNYEIIFGVADYNDPVIEFIKIKYPQTKLIIGECSGQNPKVKILQNIIKESKYDNILISDSNVRVDKDYLSIIASELENKKIGLVSNLIIGDGKGTLGSILESLQLNSNVLCGLVLSNLVGRIPCVVGKSMLIRKSTLSDIGGFEEFADVLAEDYLIGNKVNKVGWKVVTSTYPIKTINTTWTVKQFWQRHLRWTQLRKTLGFTYILELLLLPHLWLLFSILHNLLFIIPLILLYILEALAIILWSKNKITLTLCLFIVFRQFVQLAIWITALFKRSVMWRGNKIYIGKGSKIIKVA